MALVYGLAGNTAEAERLSRIDLDEAAVKTNLERIAALRNQVLSTEASTDRGLVAAAMWWRRK